MYITLHQLRIMSAVARHKNFTRVAEELNTSQPAISIQMRQLEKSVGEPLVERVNKRNDLTAMGEKVSAAANDILARLDQLDSDVQELRGEVAGQLDIAVVTSAKTFLPRYLGEFLRLYPKVKPRLTVTNRASVLEAIAENRHDLYIMGQVPKNLAMKSQPFLDNILEVVAAVDHPLAHQKNISLKRLAKEPFLVREQGSGTRIAIARVFAEQGLEIKPFMELGSSGAIKNAVIAGMGVAVLLRHSLEFELKSGSICILDVEKFPVRRRWFAAHPGGKHLSFTAQTFFDFLNSKNPLESQA